MPGFLQCSVAALLGGTVLLGAAGRVAAQPVQLTTDGLLKGKPAYILDGREIVYDVQQESRLLVLVRLNVADPTLTRIHATSIRPELNASFAADSSQFAYARSDGNQSLNVCCGKLEEPDGRVITEGRTPAISPDGKRIVYAKIGDSQELYVINADGSSDRRLTVFPEPRCYNLNPQVSPDGNTVAFSTSRHDGDLEIYTIRMDGADPRRLTTSPGRDLRPAWSPDGGRIAFSSARDGNLELYVMQADGSNQRRLTNNAESDDYPSWHPDGRHLVYVGEHDGRFDLFSIEVDR